MTRTSFIAVLLLSFLWAPGLLAQDREARWYRVELLVFTHEGSGAATSEAWEPLPALSYPERYRFLRHPEREAANREQWPSAESTVDERGVQTIVVPEPPAEDDDRLAAEDIPEAEAPDPNSVTPALDAEAPARPTPWVALPASQLEFRGKAAYMQRTGRYETLFHETWLQPMFGEADSVPLIVDRSGDAENWPQLQGSVRFYLSRFLHLETDLWLNTSGTYIPGSWTMPSPPLGPRSLIVVEPEPELEDALPESRYDTLFGTPGESDPADDAEEILEPEGPIYPWRHAVALNDKRRMRSEEVHYLDHPMLGVVVKITPVLEEELEAMAAAELLSDQPE